MRRKKKIGDNTYNKLNLLLLNRNAPLLLMDISEIDNNIRLLILWQEFTPKCNGGNYPVA